LLPFKGSGFPVQGLKNIEFSALNTHNIIFVLWVSGSGSYAVGKGSYQMLYFPGAALNAVAERGDKLDNIILWC
jgi:hypothetical protein